MLFSISKQASNYIPRCYEINYVEFVLSYHRGLGPLFGHEIGLSSSIFCQVPDNT